MQIDANTLQLAALILGGVELRLAVSKLRRDVDTLTNTKADKVTSKGRLAVRAGLLIGAGCLIALSGCSPRTIHYERDESGAVQVDVDSCPLVEDAPAPIVPELQP